MIHRRAAIITLDAACGKTYAQIAAEHQISIPRVGQIVTATLGQLRMSARASKEEIGCALARQREREPDFPRGGTPRSHYYDEIVGKLPAPSDTWY